MPEIVVRLAEPEYGFEAVDEHGSTVTMDNSVAGGGRGFGVSPMQQLLMSLGGCSGIDIVGILNKQRQEFSSLVLVIQGTREQDKTPALWEQVHIRFELTGPVDPEKARHAAALSIDKYCSVAETLRRAGCRITWDVQVRP